MKSNLQSLAIIAITVMTVIYSVTFFIQVSFLARIQDLLNEFLYMYNLLKLHQISIHH